MNKASGILLRRLCFSLIFLPLILSSCELSYWLTRPDLAEMKPRVWYTVPLGGETRSADGSPFSIFVKRGNSPNLIIYFAGGGVVWDYNSAASPYTTGSYIFSQGTEAGYYFDAIPEFQELIWGGMLDQYNTENPFNDWNVLYIPYSTGDFHAGNQRYSYSTPGKPDITLNHLGRRNVQAALDWIAPFLDTMTGKLLVAGASAGAFGSSIWLPRIREQYGTSRGQIYHLADSGFLLNDQWAAVADRYWGADWESFFLHSPTADLIGSSMDYNLNTLGSNVTVLQSHTVYDGVLSQFQTKIQPLGADSVQSWSAAALSSVKTLYQNHPRYFYFLTDYGLDKGVTPHTLSDDSFFYKASQDGFSYKNWLKEAIINDAPHSAGSDFLAAP